VWQCRYTLITVNQQLGLGAGVLVVHCQSTCNGRTITADIVGPVVGGSASPIPGGISASDITLTDPFPTPDPKNLEGKIVYGSAGIATPIPWIGGPSYTTLILGAARGEGWGKTYGIDAGLDEYFGVGTTVASKKY
jgi:hypothetical protein